MNERIRELCSQAISDVDGIQNPDTQNMYIPDCFAEKFAELIVRECAQVCLSQRDPANLNYKPSERFAEAVTQHFGVREV